MKNPVWPSSCVTPAGTSNELDVQNEWEENRHTHTLFYVLDGVVRGIVIRFYYIACSGKDRLAFAIILVKIDAARWRMIGQECNY